jgi:hypothetical protein
LEEAIDLSGDRQILDRLIYITTNLYICKRKDAMFPSTLSMIPVVINFLMQEDNIALLKAEITGN